MEEKLKNDLKKISKLKFEKIKKEQDSRSYVANKYLGELLRELHGIEDKKKPSIFTKIDRFFTSMTNKGISIIKNFWIKLNSFWIKKQKTPDKTFTDHIIDMMNRMENAKSTPNSISSLRSRLTIHEENKSLYSYKSSSNHEKFCDLFSIKMDERDPDDQDNRVNI